MRKWLKYHFWSGRMCLFWWGMTIQTFGQYLVAIAQKRRYGFLYRQEREPGYYA